MDGEVVVHLWGGHADRKGEVPFTDTTLTPVFSCSKPLSALVIAWLADRGKLTYDQRVAELWPEFAQAGKDQVTIAQALSHQAGLSGFTEGWTPEDWFDHRKTADTLAAMAPLWPPGDGSGYHPITWGTLAGEIAQRADGRSLAAIFAEEVAGPHSIDFSIGLTDDQLSRTARMHKPKGIPRFGDRNPETVAAFLRPWSAIGGRGGEEWARAEFPAANGHGTALAIARAMEVYARDGLIGEARFIAAETVAEAVKERVAGPDRVLPYWISWGVGLIRSAPQGRYYGPGARTVGHTGYGGSFVLADPDRRLTYTYAMTQQNPVLVEDERTQALIGALYGAL